MAGGEPRGGCGEPRARPLAGPRGLAAGRPPGPVVAWTGAEFVVHEHKRLGRGIELAALAEQLRAANIGLEFLTGEL